MAKSYFGFEDHSLPRLQQRGRPTATGLALIAGVIAAALFLNNRFNPQIESLGSQVAAFIEAVEEAPAPAEAAAVQPAAESPEARKQRAIAEFVARRYQVSQEVTLQLVGTAHTVARQHQLDPLLILAIIAVESRYNPIAESVMGAKGLMQIIPHFHLDKLQHWGGAKAVFEPEANIAVGAKIIKEYLGRTRDITAALQMYAGAADDADSIYAKRVFGEQQRLKQVVKPFEDGAPQRADAPGRASPAS